MANDMLRDLQTDSLIQLMLNANGNVQPDMYGETQLDEEFKVCQYPSVPDEIYEETYHFIDLSIQSENLIEKFENRIKIIIDYLEKRNKVYKLISY